jgi:hypothetical protein
LCHYQRHVWMLVEQLLPSSQEVVVQVGEEVRGEEL